MMILADTSAWIEFLRKTGSSTARLMRRRLESDEVATTDVVIAEILAGSTNADRLAAWRRALDASVYLRQEPYVDAVEAARLYRECRLGGESPRQLTDCVVAAVALRNNVPILHRDRDYDVIARHSTLRTASA